MTTTDSFDPRVAADAARYAALVSRLFDRSTTAEDRLEARIDVALEVAQDLNRCGKPTLPERWPTWPRGDRGLTQRIEALAQSREGSREREEAEAMGEYRAALWKAEQEAVARLTLLLDSLELLAGRVKAGKEGDQRNAEIETAAKDAYVFAIAHWRIAHPYDVFCDRDARRRVVDAAIARWQQ